MTPTEYVLLGFAAGVIGEKLGNRFKAPFSRAGTRHAQRLIAWMGRRKDSQ